MNDNNKFIIDLYNIAKDENKLKKFREEFELIYKNIFIDIDDQDKQKEEYNTFFDKVNKLFFIIEQNIENFKNNKNFELMQIHFKKAIEYVENNKDSYRISGEIIHAHLNYASELKNL